MSIVPLDMEKLRKVRCLIDGGSTAGERDAARSRATAIAAKAGMTLDQALSNMDTASEPSKSSSIFEGFDDWMEEKEPGYKAERARESSERELRKAAKRAVILKQFGTVKAFLSPTPREAILHTAGKPFVAKYSSYTNICGTRRNAGTPAHCGPGGVHFGHRTTADKRRAVLSILDAHPDLSDREIARRVGVSPQTVNNWRNKMKEGNAA